MTSRITGRDSHCSLPAAPPISSSQTTRGDGGSEGNPESCFRTYVPYYAFLLASRGKSWIATPRKPVGYTSIGVRYLPFSVPAESPGRRAGPKVPDEVRKGIESCLSGHRRVRPPSWNGWSRSGIFH